MAAVTATLRLDAGQYLSALKQAGAATQALAASAAKAGDKAGQSTKQFATNAAQYVSKNKDHINTVSRGVGLFGAAAAAGVVVAAKAFADFDQAMSKVAASGDDAKNNMTALRAAAMEAGASTAFSATEAAAGIENLAKAGVSAEDTLGGGLKGALDLAAAGSVDVAFAAETAATAMTQFGLKGKDVPHIADLLAAAAGKAQGEVGDFAGALNQSGLVALQFGLSIEETTGTLAAFASAGLLGSDAGTSFKTMLLRMANPSKEAAETMKDLGINAYDAQGSFVGIAPLAEQLKTSMADLSAEQRNAALATIFGSDAIRAQNVLYDQGAAGIKDWTTQVNDAGFAADTAKTKMDNLKGDLEGLSGAFETALIGLGEGANGPLRGLVQSATDAVNAFNDLGDGTKHAVLVTVAALAGLALSAAALGKIVIFAAEASVALKALGVTATATRAKLAGLNGAGLLAVAGFVAVQAVSAALDKQLESNSAGIDGYKDSLASLGESGAKLDVQFGSFGDSVLLLGQGVGDTQSAFDGLADTFNPVSQGFRKVGDAMGMSSTAGILADEFDKIDKALTQMKPEEAAAAFKKLAAEGRAAGLTTEQINATFDDYQRSLKDQALAAADAAAAADKNAKALDKEAQALGYADAAAQKTAEEIKAVTDAMYASASAALALSGGAIAAEAAMDAAAKAAKDNGKNLDISTAKGRANQGALDSLVATTTAQTKAMDEQKKPAKDIVAFNERMKESYIKSAVAMGEHEKVARKDAEALFAIPTEVKSQVVVAGAEVSKQEAKDLNKALKDIPAEQRAHIVTIAETKGAKEAQREIAKVKSKKVIAEATGKGVDTVKEIDGAIKKLTSKKVRAEAKAAGQPAVDALDKAVKDLKDRKVRATVVSSGKGGVDSLRNSIGALKSKTVYADIIARKLKGATGGLATPGGFMYSSGGPVWGAGTATSDSIPALLSNGEYVQQAAATRHYGVAFMSALNSMLIPKSELPQAFAAGGMVGFASGGPVDAAVIMRMVAQLVTPLTAVAAAARALGAARVVKAREDRELAAARRAVKSGGATKAEKANLSKQTEQQKDATSKLTDATRNLADANNAAADSARSMSDQFSDAFRSSSTDAKDWLETMTGGAKDIGAFTAQLAKLRKLGLSESLVQQLVGQGTTAGGEAAASILAGGGGLVKQLNAANKSLEKAADALGYLGTKAPQRRASGGPITGPGTGTSDSVPIMASTGEWMVPQHAVAANRQYLEAITYGRNVVSNRFAAPGHYRYGGPVTGGFLSQTLAGALQGMRIVGELEMVGSHAVIRGIATQVYGDENRKAAVSF